MNILHIDASPLGSASISRQLTASVVEKLTRDHPSADGRPSRPRRKPDLAPERRAAPGAAPAPGTTPSSGPTLRAEADQTDELINELLGADVRRHRRTDVQLLDSFAAQGVDRSRGAGRPLGGVLPGAGHSLEELAAQVGDQAYDEVAMPGDQAR